jgi:hypothetical protein
MLTIDFTATDADDRYPAQFTQHCARFTHSGIDWFIRITPGDSDSYTARGWHAAIEGSHPSALWSAHVGTLEAAQAAATEFVTTFDPWAV